MITFTVMDAKSIVLVEQTGFDVHNVEMLIYALNARRTIFIVTTKTKYMHSKNQKIQMQVTIVNHVASNLGHSIPYISATNVRIMLCACAVLNAMACIRYTHSICKR